MKNYKSIFVGEDKCSVFKIAGHDFAVYMPYSRGDKNNEKRHAYKRSTERNVNLELVKVAIEKHCDEIIEIAMTAGHERKPIVFLWRNASVVIVVGNWQQQVPTLGIITVVDDRKNPHKGDIVFLME